MADAVENNANADEREAFNVKAVYTVIDGPNRKASRWRRLGSAFVNKDGSLNVVLDALPINGRLQIRDVNDRPEKS